MTDPTTNGHHVIDRIPEYVLGALNAVDAQTIHDHLALCPVCADEAEAAAVVHGVATIGSASPPAALRDTVLAAAFAARPPAVVELEGSPEVSAWEAEIARFRALLDDPQLGPRTGVEVALSAWDAPCVPSFGLSVRDLVCHLIASESMRSERLGHRLPYIPETDPNLERRTRAVAQRHASLPTQSTIDELDRLIIQVGSVLRNMSSADRRRASDVVPGFSVDDYTALRALETWTHADDIRRTLGMPDIAPDPSHLSTMTAVLPLWIELVLAFQPTEIRDRHYRIELTGHGGRVLDVPGDRSGAEHSHEPVGPVVGLTADAVEFCKLAGARRDAEFFPYTARTEPEAAATLIRTISAFELI